MDKKIKRLVNRVKEQLNKVYGEKIKSVILYGSYVRGDYDKDSDIDLLVVVEDSLNPFEVRKRLSDLLFDILIEEGELLSVIVIPNNFFENYNSPFILNVKAEGLAA